MEDAALKAMWGYKLKDVFSIWFIRGSGEGGMSDHFFLKYLETKLSHVGFSFLGACFENSVIEY